MGNLNSSQKALRSAETLPQIVQLQGIKWSVSPVKFFIDYACFRKGYHTRSFEGTILILELCGTSVTYLGHKLSFHMVEVEDKYEVVCLM